MVHMWASDDTCAASSPGGPLCRDRRSLARALLTFVAFRAPEGLETLVTEMDTGRIDALPETVRWAVDVAAPVGDRLPLCLALALIEATMSASRGSVCVLRVEADPPGLLLDSEIEPGEPEHERLAVPVLSHVVGSRAKWIDHGHRRHVAIGLPPATAQI